MFKALKRFIRLVIFVFVIYIAFQAVSVLFPVKHEQYVEKYAAASSLEKNLVYGIINAESRFNSEAVSAKGAIGLMQIKEDTALWCAEKMGYNDFDVSDLKEPETNIKIGTWYFSYLKEQLGTEELAIASYNAGITHVKQWLEDGIIDEEITNPDSIPFEETKKYIKKVKLYEKIYEILDRINEFSSTVEGEGNK